jgi:ABC-type multidrug transport system ATPase subunit
LVAVQVRNLVKSYGDLVAVNDISFDVKEGEIFGLLGPNGAGKTTALKVIMGFYTILSRVLESSQIREWLNEFLSL